MTVAYPPRPHVPIESLALPFAASPLRTTAIGGRGQVHITPDAPISAETWGRSRGKGLRPGESLCGKGFTWSEPAEPETPITCHGCLFNVAERVNK